MGRNQLMQGFGRGQCGVRGEDVQDFAQAEAAENVTSFQPVPDFGQLCNSRFVESLANESAVDSAYGACNKQVGADAALTDGAEHAHLDRTQGDPTG